MSSSPQPDLARGWIALPSPYARSIATRPRGCARRLNSQATRRRRGPRTIATHTKQWLAWGARALAPFHRPARHPARFGAERLATGERKGSPPSDDGFTGRVPGGQRGRASAFFSCCSACTCARSVGVAKCLWRTEGSVVSGGRPATSCSEKRAAFLARVREHLQRDGVASCPPGFLPWYWPANHEVS